jgi:hypothetical protein
MWVRACWGRGEVSRYAWMLHLTGSPTVHKTSIDTEWTSIPLNLHETTLHKLQNKVIFAKQKSSNGNGNFKNVGILLIRIVGGGVESSWVHSALRPPIGRICQPRVIMIKGLVERWLCRGILSTRRKPAPVPLCTQQTPHAMPGWEPGPLRWEVSD